MEKTLDITENKLEQILRELIFPHGDGISSAELAERLNVSRATVLRLLNVLIAEGKVALAGYKVYTRIDGQKTKRPVYRVVE